MSVRSSSGNRRIIVYSLGTSADKLKNLGSYGYSYDLLKKSFLPLLADCGDVVEISKPESRLEYAVATAKKDGKAALVLGFAPFQNMHPTRSAPTVLYMCWEFPDVPVEPLNGDPRFVWVRKAKHASLVVVPTHFVKDALERAGITTPICVVPTPMEAEQFDVPYWRADQSVTIDCPGLDLNVVRDPAPAPATAATPVSPPSISRSSLARRGYSWCKRQYVCHGQEWLPPKFDRWLKGFVKRRVARFKNSHAAALAHGGTTEEEFGSIKLDGVVFTMILNPSDGRKNWQDLLTAFVHALRDRADATLVLKFSVADRLAPGSVDQVAQIHNLLANVKHRCRVVVITKALTNDQMRSLMQATTFYANSTRAEGACLPIMEAMAAGRPALSPVHTAMTDYFDGSVGFVIDAQPEPTSWPGDVTQRYSTFWARLNWQSLADQLAAAYDLAKDPVAYRALAQAARERMHQYSNVRSVREKLAAALDSVNPVSVPTRIAG